MKEPVLELDQEGNNGKGVWVVIEDDDVWSVGRQPRGSPHVPVNCEEQSGARSEATGGED